MQSPAENFIQVPLNLSWLPAEDDSRMSVDSYEDDWYRLSDIRVNGQILEYIGRGKSIIDVGLAQARAPLTTTNHYFEIEIIDPGENCYIAIGLTRRNYPKHRHPGWNKGSIGYHADDGKIFVGSGLGDPFGPRCYKGDHMGCGIIFPRDYVCDYDSDGGSIDMSPSSPSEVDDLLLLLDTSDSEDEEYWNSRCELECDGKVKRLKYHPNMLHYMEHYTATALNISGIMQELKNSQKVFFTRNGKTIGIRQVKIPKGGFFPTVGMLSTEEKVRVDLRPLTG